MLTVVTGPPCAGKSTYIRDRAKPGDVVVDLDRIALAITAEDTPHHTYPPHIRALALDARQVVIARALWMATEIDVWIIDTSPRKTSWAAYRAASAHVVKLDPGPDVVAARIAEQRPAHVMAAAADYYARRADR